MYGFFIHFVVYLTVVRVHCERANKKKIESNFVSVSMILLKIEIEFKL